ncbi:MAG: cation:proton antiporter [Mycobacterium sp.]
MHSETAFVLTVLVLCYAAVSGLVRRWYLAPALIFVVFGIVLGPSCLGLIEAGSDTKGFTVLSELALTVILFNQASALNLRTVFRRGHLPMRLLALGIPVTIALNTVIAVSVLPVLPFWEAVCLAVIVAPTEVALVDALLEDQRIPERVRHALSIESGLYDGLALAALLAALALASEQTDRAPVRWAWFAFRTEFASLAVGVLIGVIGGVVISRSSARGWMSSTWAQLATLALALVCFGLGERLHGSGFVSAFVGGLAYAVVSRRSGTQAAATQVADAAGQLLELVVFALFGAVAVVPAWRDAGWRVVVFAALALILVRIASLAIALAGSGLPRRSKLFMGWFGPGNWNTRAWADRDRGRRYQTGHVDHSGRGRDRHAQPDLAQHHRGARHSTVPARRRHANRQPTETSKVNSLIPARFPGTRLKSHRSAAGLAR